MLDLPSDTSAISPKQKVESTGVAMPESTGVAMPESTEVVMSELTKTATSKLTKTTTLELTEGTIPESALAPLSVDPASDDFWRVQAYGCVDSTNRIIKQALGEGEPEGLCATALQQKGGYGRQGRAWESPVGGLYTSFALRPSVSFQQMPLLSLVASLAVVHALSGKCEEGELAIKWPNDVLYRGGKIAGISLEAVAGGICIGVGINVFPQKDVFSEPGKHELGKYKLSYVCEESTVGTVEDAGVERCQGLTTATGQHQEIPARQHQALEAYADQHQDLSTSQRQVMQSLITRLLEEVKNAYLLWCAQGFAPFLEEYRSRMAFLGSYVKLETVDGNPFAEGELCGVNEEGLLLVRAANGEVIRAASGEVHVTALSRAVSD